MTSSQTKVYLEIVKKIRFIIQEDGLKAGDRLPSERELSARLNVGRSSVREALRSLELVGLIETRRGEGTFIRNFYENGLVQLIAPFLLQDEKTRRDLLQMKELLEKDAIRVLCQTQTGNCLEAFHEIFSDEQSSIAVFHQTFLKTLVEQVDNYLMYRVWMIVHDYASTLSCDVHLNARELHEKLYIALQNKQEQTALELYDAIMGNIQFHL
ncbi:MULTISPECIES: FadR/GntR family transcriptional regulator [unclassified Bacillus (in: firmicutes)]|uniref:FadR/GntR family transcriptional regulator n=1 Tax=unclassified Bacillus (in: firmicutes) TaxID=185979 RepID=UPI0008EFE540|nr:MULTISPECIES: GntR family transcriptional regulator [unclassified Bacillus (in: firmicutes)]SFJ26005.1 DNA-binding transcriptional regulator, FadR family [Bacillus sp. 71mf]SFS55144.1 DNA-binding transcriptional regulator, FadR family [Bacillus sp. 103mf]